MSAGFPSLRTQRVLVVDDEPALLEALKIAFTRAGRVVVSCRTFEDARAQLLSEPFDVMVTDVRLGAFNGLQLAVIARDKDREMGIIVFSGFDDPVLRAEAARLDASYVLKPVSSEHLLDLMATLGPSGLRTQGAGPGDPRSYGPVLS
jgi:DNA-binding response OmpR family regulator